MRKYKYDNYKPDIYEYDEDDNVRYCLGNKGQNPLICIGINPSWACRDFSDPTMNLLIKFYKQESQSGKQYDSCIMMNPYPLRCSKPQDLPKEFNDKIMEKNLLYINNVFKENKNANVLVMWGNYIDTNDCFREAVIQILEKALEYDMNLFHINNLSKAGNPYHLGYLNRTTDFKNGKYEIKLLDIKMYMNKLKTK